MIEFDFVVNESELDFTRAALPINAHYSILEVTYFMMPIKLAIDGIAFFLRERNGRKWHSDMPIINLASDGIIHLRRLYITKKEEFALPEGRGDLIFRLDNNDIVSIDFPQRKIHVSVAYEELLTAFLLVKKFVLFCENVFLTWCNILIGGNGWLVKSFLKMYHLNRTH